MVILISACCILAILLIASILAFRAPVSNTSEAAVSPTIKAAIAGAITALSFPESALKKYATRMANLQPISNDRLLDGKGKDHTLCVLASAASSSDSSVRSVLEQVGDVFS